ncbi:hypothetical protein WOLCODRAFT_14614 [Wolfiporia cocos MD-104 SS10]|uniref:Uncharacterized protein n=1 Tax=Wolfiporia cocos (strain MD-104) TaxID=742152 RepID=A0A2H3IV21_WOLCO|nr:hypothetical protein WOLCODRAFT_14614 [Wolfiporia cocos MD-104 SS10]
MEEPRSANHQCSDNEKPKPSASLWEEVLRSEIEALKRLLAEQQQVAASRPPITTVVPLPESPAKAMVREALLSRPPTTVHLLPKLRAHALELEDHNRQCQVARTRALSMRPIDQIEPGSYLGDMFHYVGHRIAEGPGGPSEPSSSGLGLGYSLKEDEDAHTAALLLSAGQKGLWQDKLMPTHSSWMQIREAAEILEIAENMGNPEGKEQSSKWPRVPTWKRHKPTDVQEAD